jgi:hypothetical protein
VLNHPSNIPGQRGLPFLFEKEAGRLYIQGTYRDKNMDTTNGIFNFSSEKGIKIMRGAIFQRRAASCNFLTFQNYSKNESRAD